MLGQSEIRQGKLLAQPQNMPKEIHVEPIRQCGDDFYQQSFNKYNNTRYFKLLKRYGNNPNYPQTVYIMIEKRHNGHIDDTILSYTRQMKKLIDTSNLSEDDAIIRGVKTFLSPIIAGKIIKQGGTSNQILLANGDTIDKDKLDYEPIENARYSSIAYGMYEQQIWDAVYRDAQTLFSIVDNAIKPKFSGTPANIPLNAVMFGYKGIGYPILWNGAIPIDCFINPNAIWEAAIKYACESKICR
ncbi:MAG: hypothetical protein EZS28_026309 [Streblomastix strix]|uniref:Uncharacterized protein n=1 Tax=Streblomastix strix TaxID=222440 RepID=A0A5J4V6W4_9EUKA|nr:MAG: hypothetical protein EZS28_026309 [Streblomastix strix]